MKVFHRTWAANAAAILADGFKDGTATYMFDTTITGVWVSAGDPLDANEGATGDTVIAIEIPADVIEPHEVIEEGKPYREFAVPANVLNSHRPFTLADESEFDDGRFAGSF